MSVLNLDEVAPSEIAVSGEGPWHLPIRLLVLGESLGKGEFVGTLLGVEVLSLDGIELQVLVPVTDPGSVGVARSTLQLLNRELHLF